MSRSGPVRLRRARATDAAAMARVMRAAVRGEAGRYPARLLAAWGGLPALYHRWAVTAGGEARLLAVLDGRVLGFAGVRGHEVTALFVLPGARRQGLGARLLSAAEGLARRGPARPDRLTVLAARGAIDFYLAHGWRVVQPEPSALPGGLALPASRMVKREPPRTPRPGAGGGP